ncbi:MAG: hypothetical protein KatS3mg061_1060 [Dehalococcoidia bacterium]|nr:MAG: hypothetical protein KatS3mg061_1060 [Dehalococcoidia bacterium]
MLSGTIPLGSGSFPYGIAADPPRGRVYVADFAQNRLVLIDVPSQHVIGQWHGNGLSSPYGLTVDPATGTVYVANSSGNTISVFASTGQAVGSPIPVGNDPRWVALYRGVTPAHLFVSNHGDGAVSVLRATLPLQSPFLTLPVGSGPIGIAVAQATGQVYVANTGLANVPSSSVTILQDTPPPTPTSTATPTPTSTPIPLPTILGITPVALPQGSPGFVLKIVGGNFISDTQSALESQARWNDADRVTSYISSTLLYADILASDLTQAGVASVTVFNPEAGTSNAAPFTILSPTPTATPVTSPTPTSTPAVTATPTATPVPLPTLLAIAPVSAPVGSFQVILALTGTNFLVLPHQPGASSVVRWNGQSLTTHPISSTLLYGVLSAAQLDTPGTFNVTVYNPGMGSSNALPFTVASAPPTPTATPPTGPTPTATPVLPPLLQSAQPPALPAGPGGAAILLGGQNFVPQSVARWNGSPRTTRFVNAATLVLVLEAGDLSTSATSAQLTVVNPGGLVSTPLTYPILQPSPTATPLTDADAPSQPANANSNCHCHPEPAAPGDRLPATQPDGPARWRQRGDPGERVPAELGRRGRRAAPHQPLLRLQRADRHPGRWRPQRSRHPHDPGRQPRAGRRNLGTHLLSRGRHPPTDPASAHLPHGHPLSEGDAARATLNAAPPRELVSLDIRRIK